MTSYGVRLCVIFLCYVDHIMYIIVNYAYIQIYYKKEKNVLYDSLQENNNNIIS